LKSLKSLDKKEVHDGLYNYNYFSFAVKGTCYTNTKNANALFQSI